VVHAGCGTGIHIEVQSRIHGRRSWPDPWFDRGGSPGRRDAFRATVNDVTSPDLPLLDLGGALELLAAAVEARGEYFAYPLAVGEPHASLYSRRGGPRCLVGHALSLAHVGDSDLDELDDRGVRELYRHGKLPVRLTIGALVVLDAAQRTQDRGYTWGDALEYASDVAVRFLDLVPDSLFEACSPPAASDSDSSLST
jgi:hypothetical protein